ncbi:DUF5007 domain-containing protein [Paraflavitalea sp. CAU 1676]|uniref:DUF5007 domain-containing protein n=1 Tax=Paraflavitalea sp. CAU 1676 TaxID=3032598 RepID=UPI0023DB95DB|nr:DUF5007 domain-containing protein [Paraflavitalea sp. CAU 1676]MDF2189174.1 DUF5007 domain-containing protein [Paraflavitalea sp. CAU 1676]
MKKLLYTAAGLLTILTACEKIEEGFLSDLVRYKDNVIQCKRGMPLVKSAPIEGDGSTPPYTFKMVNLRDANGKAAPKEFDTEYDLVVFKEGLAFNPETDTTLALLNKKRETLKVKPLIFNEKSGQIVFNRGSTHLPLGDYQFDVEMNNVKGTKLFPSIAKLQVVDPLNEDFFTLYAAAAAAATPAEAFSDMKAPRVTCKRVSGEGARVILKIVDKNGVTFNPKAGEIIKRGDRPIFETYAKFNPVIITDTAMICDFEVAPFPMAKYITPATNWGYLIYYRIPAAFIQVDEKTAKTVSANPRFEFQLMMEGTYVVEVKLTDAIKL